LGAGLGEARMLKNVAAPLRISSITFIDGTTCYLCGYYNDGV
jgi:hypothetical protein